MNSADQSLGFLGLLFVSRKALIGEELSAKLEHCILLLNASDATSIQALGIRHKAELRHTPLYGKFTEEELGHALGRDKVTFVGIIDKKAAAAFLAKTGLLKGPQKP